MKVVFALVPIALLFNVILGYPDGAPNKACISISPDPKAHGAPPQRSRSPFILTIQGNPTEYVPGQQYTLTLSARKHKRRFRGFLVVSQNSNKDRVGSFTAGKGQHQACSDRSGITHSNGMKKRFVTLTWTAPPEGTGAVVFKYAVVRSRKIYWADRQGPILQERSVTSTTAVEPSSKAFLTSSALPSSKVPLISSSTSTSTTSSVTVTSSEVGTSTSSPTPSATTSTATGEATSTGPSSSTSVEASSRRTSSVAIVTPSVAPIASPSVAPITTPSVTPAATPSVAPSNTPTPSTSTSAPIVTVPGTDGNGSRGSSSFAGMAMTVVFLIIGLLAMMI